MLSVMEVKEIKVDKIASVLKNIFLTATLSVTNKVIALEGMAVVVEAVKPQMKYCLIELVDGRLSKVYKGDLIATCLGERKALEGIVGIVPDKIKPGDTLNILNLGGIVGQALSWNKKIVSKPIEVKVIGSIVKRNKIININDFSLEPSIELKKSAPIIVVLGTGMNTGKTTVATELVHLLAKKKKLKVGAAKLTGVATQRDILAMEDAGAIKTLTFLDAGLASTVSNHHRIVPAAKAVINALNKRDPDIIVIELGDGVIGWYGVDKLLADSEFSQAITFSIVCANDLAGAVAISDLLKKNNLAVDLFAGPVTNNSAGTDYLEKVLGILGEDIRGSQIKLLKALESKGVVKS